MNRARVVTLNAALGPLDYRVPAGMEVRPGSVVAAPVGPRQLLGVVWEADRLPANEVLDERFQPVNGNQAIGAGTPTLMPIMPALKWRLNWRAA
jgi:primosomal protein N' (replication factor Y)